MQKSSSVAVIILLSMLSITPAGCSSAAIGNPALEGTKHVTEKVASEIGTVALGSPTATEPAVSTKPSIPTSTADHYDLISISAPDCDYGGRFKTIEALDKFTIRFVMCAPEPAFLPKIAFPTFGIQPREWLEETGGGGEGSPLLEKPIGTGPYMLGEWKRGDELILTAFERYWGGEKARIGTLVFRWNRDPAQRLLELQTRMVDGIDNVNSADFANVKDDPSLALIPRPALNVFYIGLNNIHPPFDNEKVRQAIAMGIDRQQIVTDFFPEGYEVASYFTPCAIPNGCVGEPWYQFDPAKARDLLAEAGFPDGFQTELYYRDVVRGYLPQPGQVAEGIKDQLWENINIRVKIRKMESDSFLKGVDEGELPGLHLLGWGANYPDVINFLNTHFGVEATGQFGNQFEDILKALQGGAELFGEEARRPYYEAANNALKAHVPAIPISHGGWVSQGSLAVAYQKDVEGDHASPLGLEEFSVLSNAGQERFVWMQEAEPLSLYCADETDVESLRVCGQVTECLYRYAVGGVAVQPGLAEVCVPNDDLSVWTCTLREGVKFQDGSTLDANDVVMSLWVQWDAAHPLHSGHTGDFHYFKDFWGDFLNAPNQ